MSRRWSPEFFALDDWEEEDHQGITVTCPLYSDTWAQHLPAWSLADVHASRVRSAGALARLGLALDRELGDVRTAHRCRIRFPGDVMCGISISHVVLSPGADLGDIPYLDVAVPRGQGHRWRKRVGHLLTALAAADANPEVPGIPYFPPENDPLTWRTTP